MSNTIDVNSVLAQIRALSSQTPVPQRVEAKAAPEAKGSFGSLVRESIDKVNTAQQNAGSLQQKFEMGDPATDLSSVMLATSKAQVAFRAMVETRNRLVSAYQDVMNMPI